MCITPDGNISVEFNGIKHANQPYNKKVIISKASSGSDIFYFGEMKHWRWYVVTTPFS